MSFFFALTLPFQLLAQNAFSGYYRFESGALTQSNGEFLFNRNILQTDFQHQASRYSVNLGIQLRQNINPEDTFNPDIRLREAYIDLNGNHFDLRIGQQMIVWGRTDAAQIHDIITPMDLTEFLTQDFVDLRSGVPAINFTYYRENNDFQFILIPVFIPSNIAEPGTRWSAWPNEDVDYLQTAYPTAKISSTQFALRWNNRANLNWDIDISVYSGFNPTPALTKQVSSFIPAARLQVEPNYFRNNAIMIGAEFRANQYLVMTTEHSFWTNSYFDDLPLSLRNSSSIDFDEFTRAQNNDFLISSPFLQSMWGIRIPLFSGSFSLQYLLEYILDHEESMLQNESHHMGSMLYTRSSTNEKWNFRFLSRYHLSGNDAWINPDITFTGIDGARFSAGAHIFVGNEPETFYGHLSFNNYIENSFVYLKLTAYW